MIWQQNILHKVYVIPDGTCTLIAGIIGSWWDPNKTFLSTGKLEGKKMNTLAQINSLFCFVELKGEHSFNLAIFKLSNGKYWIFVGNKSEKHYHVATSRFYFQ